MDNDYFCLEFDTCGDYLKSASGDDVAGRFAMEASDGSRRERVVLLSTGEHIATHAVRISKEHILTLSFCLHGDSSEDRRSHIEFRCRDRDGRRVQWMAYQLTGLRPGRWAHLRIYLAQFSDEVQEFEIAMVSPPKERTSIGISRLAICRESELPRINALSNYKWRMENEMSHFSGAAYTHSMYQDKLGEAKSKEKNIVLERERRLTERESPFLREQEQRLRNRSAQIQPQSGEQAYNYALRCLGMMIPYAPPNYFARAANLSRGRSIRVLSMCCGAARTEERLLKDCEGQIELTLLDASEDLLQRAATRFSDKGYKVRCLVGDINDGLPSTDSFDIIMCVSALHHVANLEKVLTEINERLSGEGEFWSIGEQIGRNGNRLWPEAEIAANNIFGKLPEKYRKNAHTKVVDAAVPGYDFSTGCFEGIRSEELGQMLETYLIPVDVYKRNCFLWRLVDAAYSDNYDLSVPQDIALLQDLVVAEAMHWLAGGRGTELHGVYRQKHIKE